MQHSKTTHSTDKVFAQRFLNKKLQEIGGRRPLTVDPSEVTYEDLRDAHVAECIAKKQRSVRRGTLHFARLDKFFGGWHVKDFGVASLKRFRQECRRDGITDATVNRSMAALRRMFNLAVENELIERADIPSYFPMVKEPKKNLNAIFIKDEWYQPLAKTLTEPLRSAFVLCYHTGMRVHEMLRLRWRHVEMAKHMITLPGEITKTGDPRTVFIPGDFGLKPGKADDQIFPLSDRHSAEWKRACVAVGMGHYRCRKCGATEDCGHLVRLRSYVGTLLRHTRHTAVRNFDEAGNVRDRAKAITGHITDSTYSRYNIGKERDVDDARLLAEQAHQRRREKLDELFTQFVSKYSKSM